MSTVHIVTLSRVGSGGRSEIVGAFTTLDAAKDKMAEYANICATACHTMSVQGMMAINVEIEPKPTLTCTVRLRDGTTCTIVDATQPHFFAEGTRGCVAIKGRAAGLARRQEYVFWESNISSIISHDE